MNKTRIYMDRVGTKYFSTNFTKHRWPLIWVKAYDCYRYLFYI